MISLFKKLIEIIPAKDKFKLFVLFCMMVLAGFLEALSIGIIAGFVAVVANPNILFEIEILSPLFEFLGVESSRDVLVFGSIFLIFVFLLKNAYLVFYKYVKARFIYHRYQSISNQLFKIYMQVPYSFHLRRNSADLVRNVTHETQSLASNIMMPVLQIATEIVMSLIIVTVLFVVEPVVTLFALIFLGGLSFFFLQKTKKKIKKYGKAALEERRNVIKTVNEGVGGLKEAIIMNRQSWFVSKFEKSIKTLSQAQIFKQTTKHIARPIIETMAVVGMLLIALFLLDKGYSIGHLASILALFALSIQRLLPAVHKIVENYTSLRYHAYALDPIYEDLTGFKEYLKEKNEKERIHLKEKIEVKNLTYSYPQTKEKVLKNISLSVPHGSAVGFVGATGSGKTTLIDLILGLLEPTEGKILVDGKDVKDDVTSWQKNIGYIPQFIYLSDDTIRNNIAFGLEKEDIEEEKLRKAVKAAQLEEFIERLPQGIDTLIGERGVRLSGGQRQRIGIARALYNNPEVLVMDEATSSLDNITEKFVIESIERLKKERTVVIIAHRLKTVKSCDKLYLMKGGEIIEEGKYEELLEKNGDFKLMAG